jgi:molecular chaperone DnaJ
MVETPVKLNEDQKELLRKFDQSLENDKRDHNPRANSWMDGVKRFFEKL